MWQPHCDIELLNTKFDTYFEKYDRRKMHNSHMKTRRKAIHFTKPLSSGDVMQVTAHPTLKMSTSFSSDTLIKMRNGYFSNKRGNRTKASHCSPTFSERIPKNIRFVPIKCLEYFTRVPLSNSFSAEFASFSGSPKTLSLKMFTRTPNMLSRRRYNLEKITAF